MQRVLRCFFVFSVFLAHVKAMRSLGAWLVLVHGLRFCFAQDCAKHALEVGRIADDGINNFKFDAMNSLWHLTESFQSCSWTSMAAKMLSDYIGYGLVQDGNSGVTMDSDLLAKFWSLRSLANSQEQVNKSWADLWLDETKNKHNKTTLEWEIHVLTKKFWAMTTNDEKDFKQVIENLTDYNPVAAVASPAVVCIHGATHLAKESLVFSHYTWGHLYPVAVAVAKAGFLDRRTKLLFASRPFLCPRVTWLAFYGLFFDELPKFDPLCQGATAEVSLDEAVPVMTQYTAENLHNNHTLSDQNTWERHFEHCTWRPKIQKAMAERFNFRFKRKGPEGLVNIIYLRRGVIGAVGRVGGLRDFVFHPVPSCSCLLEVLICRFIYTHI